MNTLRIPAKITLIVFLNLLCLFIGKEVLAATVNISITDFQFTPNSVTIDLGDTVTWTNNGNFTHTTTADHPAGLWDKTLAPGASYSRVFSAPDKFTFHCKIHTSMTGTIIVRTTDQTHVQMGKDIIATTVPLNLNLTGRNLSLVYLGSYIVNTQSGCANCHSCPTYKPGNNPYQGQPKLFNTTTYLAGGTSVTGGGVTAVSANLTPDSSGKPAGLSLNGFKNLLRTGHDPDVPGALLQVMPWPVFGAMSDRDLSGIYEYLLAIPPSATPTTLCTQPGQ